MIGLLSTIPVMLLIILFIAKSVSIIRRDMLKKLNQTTRRFQLFIAASLIIGTLPYILEILNGIYFDLLPDDPYLPLVLDRWTLIGGFLGICLITTVSVIAFIRLSFLMNISKQTATKWGVLMLGFLILIEGSLIIEASLFTSKAYDDAIYLRIFRYIILGGSFCSYAFVFWFILSLINAIYSLSKSKKNADAKKVLAKKVFLLAYSSLTFACFFLIFYTMALASATRNEYILFLNLCGACIGFSALPLIDCALLINSKLIEILSRTVEIVDRTPKSKKKVVSNSANTKAMATATITMKEIQTEIRKDFK